MPHLRFDLSVPVDDDDRDAFAPRVAQAYAEIMDTGTDHVGVVVVESDPRLERAERGERVALVNCDVRVGRSLDQRRRLARRLTDLVGERFGVPARTVYVVFTEHEGEDFVLGKEPLDEWSETEAETGVGGGGEAANESASE